MKDDPQIGSKVGRFEILAELGGGGFATVYHARDTELRREVALKLLKIDRIRSADDRERFAREARVASLLNHSNICTIYDIGEDDGRPFIIMELLRGSTLAKVIEGGKLPTDRALALTIDVALGLEAANDKNLVHRDLKPANIFITEQDHAKILDFGLAKLLPGSPDSTDEAITKIGNVLGTDFYMSPEQTHGLELDHRSDIFSIGAVLYEMITGKRAFPGKTAPQIYEAIRNEDPEPVNQLNSQITPDIMRVIALALRKNIDGRYQSIRDMRLDLQAIRRGAKLQSMAQDTASPSTNHSDTEAATLIERSLSRMPEPSATNSVRHCTELILKSLEAPTGRSLSYEEVQELFAERYSQLRPQLGRPLLRFFKDSFDRARVWLTSPIHDYATLLASRLLQYLEHAHNQIVVVATEIALSNNRMVSEIVLTDFSAPVLRVLQKLSERFSHAGAVKVHLITSTGTDFNWAPDLKSWQEELRKLTMKLYSLQPLVKFADADNLVFRPLQERIQQQEIRAVFIQGTERAYPDGKFFDFQGIAELSDMAARRGLETYVIGECYKVQPLGRDEHSRDSGLLGASLRGASAVLSDVKLGGGRKFVSDHGIHGIDSLGLSPNTPLNCCYRSWRNFMEGKNFPLGVIFDLDGTLLDSEPVHKELYQEMAGQIGSQLTDEVYFASVVGMRDSETLEYIIATSGKTIPSQERARLIQQKQTEFRKILQGRLIPAMPGAVSYLRNLSQEHFLLGVATSATADEAEIALRNMGIRDLIHTVVSASDVVRGKPSPEVYETAIKKLGLRPQECLVYEDSPRGVQAAIAARVAVVRISDRSDPTDNSLLTIPNFEFHNIPELPPQ